MLNPNVFGILQSALIRKLKTITNFELPVRKNDSFNYVSVYLKVILAINLPYF